MDYIYYHCLGNLVLLAGGDLQEPNLFHQVQLYSHFPELKCNSLTFKANANCLSKKKKKRGVSPPRWWFDSDVYPLLTQITQISKFGNALVTSISHAKNIAPIGRPQVDTSHFFISRNHFEFETPSVFLKTLWGRKRADCWQLRSHLTGQFPAVCLCFSTTDRVHCLVRIIFRCLFKPTSSGWPPATANVSLGTRP